MKSHTTEKKNDQTVKEKVTRKYLRR